MIAGDVMNRQRGAATAPPLRLELVLGGLAVASTIELLLLRTFTRTAVHIPALSELRDPYEVLASIGRYSYYVSAVLLMLALPLMVARLWGRGDLFTRTAAAAVGLFVVMATAARADVLNVVAIDVLAIGAVMLVASAAAARMEIRSAVVVWAFAAAFALQGTSSMLQDAASQGFGSYDSRWLMRGAEWLALGFAVGAPFAFRVRMSRWMIAAAVVAGAVTFAALVGKGESSSKILLLWNEGLAGSLPAVAYAAGAGLLLATVLGMAGQRRLVPVMAFVLLVAGGIGLHSTYQTGLVVAGMAALCLAARDDGIVAGDQATE